jgi:serine palmitoyltransferase
MGTFTKSFAAAGGYICGSKITISYIRHKSASFYYATSISPPIAQQIISVIRALMDINNNNSDALQRIKRLHENTKYFRQQLVKSGFHIDGNNDSPVIPLMVYSPANLKFVLMHRNLF